MTRNEIKAWETSQCRPKRQEDDVRLDATQLLEIRIQKLKAYRKEGWRKFEEARSQFWL